MSEVSAMKSIELQRWEDHYNDQSALIQDPEAQQFLLIELANQLHQRKLINPDELAELLEQADAAYAFGVEAQLTDELNRKEKPGE